MQGVFFQNGLRVIKQVLDWFQRSKDESEKTRRSDYIQPGITAGELNDFDILIGTNNAPLTPSVTISTGIAYDSNGERIIIDDDTIPYDPTNPAKTTDDGLGNFLSTPHSTGSKNIPLYTNSLNYLWIDYLQTTDETEFTLHKVTKGKLFYKLTDGYIITVTTTNVPPTALSLTLGYVNLTSFGVVSPTTIFKTGRVFALVKTEKVLIHTPKADHTDATTSYGFNEDHTLDEHIKAVGTGSITPTNPHGMTPFDIGINVGQEVETHQKYLHTTGIVGNVLSSTSSLWAIVSHTSGLDDYITIKALSADEAVDIEGVTVLNIDIPNDVVLLFNSMSDPGGLYYVYLNKNTKTVSRSTSLPGSNVIPLWAFTWTPSISGGVITGLIDLRVFGNIATRELQIGAVTSEKITAPLWLPYGSAPIPTYSFLGDTDTGIFHSSFGGGGIGFAQGGTEIAVFNTNGLTVESGSMSVQNYGTYTTPGYGFNATNAGMYLPSTSELSFSVQNAKRMSINNSDQVLVQNGTASLPSLTFINDPNTGIYHAGTESIGFTANSTLVFSAQQTYLTQTVQMRGIDTPTYASPPAYSFTNATNSGLYRGTGGNVGLLSAGNSIIEGSGAQVNIFINNGNMLRVDSSGVMSYGDFHFSSNSNDKITEVGAGTLALNTSGGATLTLTTGSIGIYPTASVTLTSSSGFARFLGPNQGLTAGPPWYPTYSFTNAPTTGFAYNISGGSSFDVIYSGNQNGYWNGGGYHSYSNLYTAKGSTANPAHTFNDDTTAGMYMKFPYPYTPPFPVAIACNGGDGVLIDTARQVHHPNQACFFVYQITTQTNVTGQLQIYYPKYDGVRIDQHGDYNPTTGYFTAPVDGQYLFTYQMQAEYHAPGTQQYKFMYLDTSNDRILWMQQSFVNETYMTYTQSAVMHMDAGDTARTIFQIGNSGGSANVDFVGRDGGDMGSCFSGVLVA